MTTATRTERTEVTSLQRGLTILELLAECPDGATLSQLSQRLELPSASTLRIARTLVQLGYLSREDDSKRFFITNRSLRLGQPHGRSRALSECALPAMRSIRQTTGETTQLCCLVDLEMVVVEQLLAVHAFKYSAEIGARCPCFSCAPGKAIIAFLPEDVQSTLVDRIRFKQFTNNTISTRKEFRRELAQVRSQGYAIDRAEGLEGIHCVAAPILDSHGSAVAAITIAGPSSRVREDGFEVMGEVLREGALLAAKAFNSHQ